MNNYKYFKVIEKPEQFIIKRYYAILDKETFKQTDFFLCNNIDTACQRLDFYKDRCLIVEYLTDKEIQDAIDNLHAENNTQYWMFVRAAHSKSTAPLMRCVELQREQGNLRKWLNARMRCRNE